MAANDSGWHCGDVAERPCQDLENHEGLCQKQLNNLRILLRNRLQEGPVMVLRLASLKLSRSRYPIDEVPTGSAR
jgi:hypothetical protein